MNNIQPGNALNRRRAGAKFVVALLSVMKEIKKYISNKMFNDFT